MRLLPIWAVVLLLALPALALDVPPAPTLRVNDYAGVLSVEDRRSLDAMLAAHERATTNQVVIAIFPSLGGENLEAFSMRLAEAWKIGQAGKDNGVIISVFLQDRKIRIEVGYGLEGALPDVVCKRIIDEEITPRFRQQDYAGGLKAAVDRLASRREVRLRDALDSGLPATVADYAGLLSLSQRGELEKQLPEIASWSGVRVVCVLFASLESRPIEAVASEIRARWISSSAHPESTAIIAAFLRERKAVVVVNERLGSRYPRVFLDSSIPAMVFDSHLPGDVSLLGASGHLGWALLGDYDFVRLQPRSWERERARAREVELTWQRVELAFFFFILSTVSLIFLLIVIRSRRHGGSTGSFGSSNRDWSSGGSSSSGGDSSSGGGSFGGGGASGGW